MESAPARVEKLPRSYGRTYEADLAAIARDTFAHNPPDACRQINNEEWWNDTQSLAAIDLSIDGGFSPRSREDARSLRRALIEIFITMRAYDERNETGELVICQLRKWIDSHV